MRFLVEDMIIKPTLYAGSIITKRFIVILITQLSFID